MSTDNIWESLPTAKQVMEQVTLAEAKKISDEIRGMKKAEAERKELIDRLTKPSGVSDEEALKRVTLIVQRAVRNGLTEVDVFRFPNVLCTDHGRAINNGLEPGWQDTLIGLPKEMHEFWKRQLEPRGYKINFRVVDYSGGIPGDIGITLRWS